MIIAHQVPAEKIGSSRGVSDGVTFEAIYRGSHSCHPELSPRKTASFFRKNTGIISLKSYS